MNTIFASDFTGLIEFGIIIILGSGYLLLFLLALILLGTVKRREAVLDFFTCLSWAGLPMLITMAMLTGSVADHYGQIRLCDFALTGIAALLVLAVFITRLKIRPRR